MPVSYKQCPNNHHTRNPTGTRRTPPWIRHWS